MEEILLTQFAHGAGCGCKIAPDKLQEILKGQTIGFTDSKLLVGNDTADDAAVYQLDDGGNCIISTTDFFTPIVNDAFDFGRVAATNAISDVYAMGGKPLLAIAILGWPVEKLPTALANRVIEGARSVCAEAGIPLAGGHSIDSPEPIFGLSVTGLVKKEHIKQNNTAKPGDLLFLTKPIGVGILTTAEKRNALLPEHKGMAIAEMTKLNKIGAFLGEKDFVSAITDITGFGLAGHLTEMCGDYLSAELNWSAIPFITDLSHYIKNRILPDATFRNWNNYGKNIAFESGVPVMDAFNLLPDPQTSGGLLVCVNKNSQGEMERLLQEHGIPHLVPIGRITGKKEKTILISA
jgi:selenide, water dikinase